MPTYIEREFAEVAIFNAKWYDNADEDVAWDALHSVPRVDIVPIKKGIWIESNPSDSCKCRIIECNVCGKIHIVGNCVSYADWTLVHKYCENCGAKMAQDEEVEADNGQA